MIVVGRSLTRRRPPFNLTHGLSASESSGGSERIRTSEGLNIPSGFQDRPVRPLRHASIYCVSLYSLFLVIIHSLWSSRYYYTIFHLFIKSPTNSQGVPLHYKGAPCGPLWSQTKTARTLDRGRFYGLAGIFAGQMNLYFRIFMLLS